MGRKASRIKAAHVRLLPHFPLTEHFVQPGGASSPSESASDGGLAARPGSPSWPPPATGPCGQGFRGGTGVSVQGHVLHVAEELVEGPWRCRRVA